MDHNGQDNQALRNQLTLVDLTGSAYITPADHTRNRARIANARAYLDRLEAENDRGFARYSQDVQQLQQFAEQGRRADAILAQLRSGSQVSLVEYGPPQQSNTVANHHLSQPILQGGESIREARNSGRSVAHPSQMQHMSGSSIHGTHSPRPPTHQTSVFQPLTPGYVQPTASTSQAPPENQRLGQPGTTGSSMNSNHPYRHYRDFQSQASSHTPALPALSVPIRQEVRQPKQNASSLRNIRPQVAVSSITHPQHVARSQHPPDVPLSKSNSLAGALGSQSQSPHENGSTKPTFIQHETSAAHEPALYTREELLTVVSREIFSVMKDVEKNVAEAVNGLVLQNLQDLSMVFKQHIQQTTISTLSPSLQERAQSIAAHVAHLIRQRKLNAMEVIVVLRNVEAWKKTVASAAPATFEVPTAPLSAESAGSTRVTPKASHAIDPPVPNAVPGPQSGESHPPPLQSSSTPIATEAQRQLDTRPVQVNVSQSDQADVPISGSGTDISSSTVPFAMNGVSAHVSFGSPAAQTWQESARHYTFASSGQNHSAGQTVLNTPSPSQATVRPGTPPSATPATQSPKTPASANKSRLARDILRALGRPSAPLSMPARPPAAAQIESPNIIALSSTEAIEPALVHGESQGPTHDPAVDESVSLPRAAEVPEMIEIDNSSSHTSRTNPLASGMPTRQEGDEDATYPQPVESMISDTTGQYSATNDAPRVPLHTVDVVEEISTPGAIAMAMNEAQEVLRGHIVPPYGHAEVVPMTTSEPASPLPSSVASPPPVSRLSTPIEYGPTSENPQVPVEEPVGPGEPLSLSIVTNAGSPTGSQLPADVGAQGSISDFKMVAHPASPSALSYDEPPAGSSKEPLFLSSPVSSAASVVNQILLPTDAPSDLDSFVPSGLLDVGTPPPFDHKGKGRERDYDDDIEEIAESDYRSNKATKRQKLSHCDDPFDDVQSSEPGEVRETSTNLASTPRHGWKVEVLVPRSSVVDGLRNNSIRLSTGSSPLKTPRKHAKKRRIDSDSSSEGDSLDHSRNHIPNAAQRAKQLAGELNASQMSSNRLHESPCRWRACDAMLESTERLVAHAQQHVWDTEEPPFMCEWEDCNRSFPTREHLKDHLRSHAESPLVCAFAGCEEVFRTPRELFAHHNDPKHQSRQMKPTAAHFFWARHSKPAEMPETVPSYMCDLRPVMPARIPQDVHAWLGPKIAANITCYIHPGGRPNAAAPSRTTRRLAENIAAVEQAAREIGVDPSKAILLVNNDEYDNWIGYNSQRGPKYCDNLPSAAVTRMVEEGITIGSEYLAGDTRWEPPENVDKDGCEEEESDQPAVHDAGGRDSPAHDPAGTKPDEAAADATAGMEVPVVLIREPSTDVGPVAQLSPPREPSISHGDEQNFDGVRDVDMAGYETMSQPRWEFIRN